MGYHDTALFGEGEVRISWLMAVSSVRGKLAKEIIRGEDGETHAFVVVRVARDQRIKLLLLRADHLYGVFEVFDRQDQGR